jgi:hypothetical protein
LYKKLTAFALLLSLLALLAACGSATQATIPAKPTIAPTPTPLPIDGYLSQDSTGVYWVQWTELNGQLTGNYNAYTLDDSTNQYASITFPITGTHSGRQININIEAGLIKLPASGTIDSKTLTLAVQSNGQIKTRSFTGTTMSAYQQALSAFSKKHPLPATPTPTA